MENFDSKFNLNAKQNDVEKKEAPFEVMAMPEVVIQEERGTQLFSLLLKAENREWGETETPLAIETAKYFDDNPLGPDVLNTIREFRAQEVDEETLYNLALTYHRPKRKEEVFNMMKVYKLHVKNPQEKYRKFITILESIDQSFSSSPLATKFNEEMQRDKNKRLARLEETKERITNLINFFKPNSKTTSVQKINFIPTDPLYKANSGRTFLSFAGKQIIMSHIDNTDNQDHEFTHGIINPIVDKLSQKLTVEQKEKISHLASNKLKQDYGGGFYSLLCEEFIRTYNDVFKKGKEPETYTEFVEKISRMNEEQFQSSLLQSESFNIRCDELDIASIDDFKNKSQEYFKRFEENPLRKLIFELYQEYSNHPDKETINFEQFILTNFPTRI